MKQYRIGIDGGGTATVVEVADGTGREVERFQGGSINYNGNSREMVEATFSGLFGVLRDKGYLADCASLCIGAAGISNEEACRQLRTQVKSSGYQGLFTLTGDHETALYGALEQPEGAIVIAGTGSICYASDGKGHTVRAGGYGHLIGDEGSAYAIAIAMLRAVFYAQDGRGEETVLRELVLERLQIRDTQGIIRFLYDKERNKKEVAAIAVLLEEALHRQDGVAQRIARDAARDLCALAAPAARFLKGRGLLAAAGSILVKNETVYREFTGQMRELYPELTVLHPKRDAAHGAVLIALKALEQR